MASHPSAASGNSAAALTLAELREFASFSPGAQRYIKRALDIGLAREDAFKRWARYEVVLQDGRWLPVKAATH